MNDLLPCLGCPAMLPAEATACPACLRARSQEEIVRGRARLRAEASRLRARPFKIAATVLLLAAAAAIGWEHRAGLSLPRTPPPPAPVAAPPPKRPPAKDAWRVSGRVYDLKTLAPVPGAEVAFQRDGAALASTMTDAKGAYEIDLAKADGWTVSLKAPGHLPGQVLDVDPSFLVRDAEERLAALEHLTEEDLAPVRVGWKRDGSMVRLDLVAVPPR